MFLFFFFGLFFYLPIFTHKRAPPAFCYFHKECELQRDWLWALVSGGRTEKSVSVYLSWEKVFLNNMKACLCLADLCGWKYGFVISYYYLIITSHQSRILLSLPSCVLYFLFKPMTALFTNSIFIDLFGVSIYMCVFLLLLEGSLGTLGSKYPSQMSLKMS